MTSRDTTFAVTSIAAALALSMACNVAATANAGGVCETSGHDCFTTGGPGCTDVECCEAVCAVDPFCCVTAWDGICVGEANSICVEPVGPCCIAQTTPGCGSTACEDAVCQPTFHPECCDMKWDSNCAGYAYSIPACGCTISVPCSTATNRCFSAEANAAGPGCKDPGCCETVCAVDPFCCDVVWDATCVTEALGLCVLPLCCNLRCPADLNYDGQVGGGDLGILLADWNVTDTCSNLDGRGSVNGGDLGILLAAWGDCIGADYVIEPEPCGDDLDGGCNVPIIGDSNCCVANGGLGCDDPACTAAVCGVDPFCCDVAWDGICASEALAFCPDLCQQGVPQFAPIACGDKVIGTAWADGNLRDTDWYQITLVGPTQVTLTCQSQLPMIFGIVDTGGVPDCALAAQLNPFGVTEFCGSASIDFCLPPGTWWLFAAPNIFDNFPCDSGDNHYWIELECFGNCEPLACGNAGHDCFTSGGPYCDDTECCNTVCAIDPFCCDVAWDDVCVGEAQIFCVTCEVGCVGTPEGEPCGADTNGGCNSFPPVFGSIACGQTICGTAWAAGDTRDTDWFQITTGPGTTVVTITSFAEFPAVIGIVDTGGVPDCSLAGALIPFVQANACAEATIGDFCLPPGTWWVFIAPSVFDGFPCDGGTNDYELTLACDFTKCTPIGCGSAGHDCFTEGGPFCDDIACCELVCGIDPFCCDVAWDGICVQEATDFCGGTPPLNNECIDAIAIGLGGTLFSTVGATTSGPPLDPSCERGFGLAFVNDIWFTYMPTTGGTLTVSTCGSGFDTRLAAYTGPCASLVLVACNDDFCSLQSTMSFPVSAGTTYRIRVGGFSGSGSGTLTLSQ